MEESESGALVPKGYRVVELNRRVIGVKPDFITRFKWRAEHRCRKFQAEVLYPSYRYEVCDWLDGRWAVVAMQNVLEPIRNDKGKLNG